MSTIFQADLIEYNNKSVNINNGDLKQIVLKHNEANSGITFEGNSNISVENSSEVVIGTLTQFMGPVTIMQENSLKKPLTKSEKGEIPNISTYVHASYVDPPSIIQNKPIKFWEKKRNLIPCLSVFTILIILLIISISLSVNRSFHELKSTTVSSVLTNNGINNRIKNDTLFRNRVKYVMISHSNGRQCKTDDSCEFTVGYHQNFHSHSAKYGNPNFGHNFFIGGNGYFYLDKGWNVKNNVSDNNIELCFMGNYMHDIVNKSMATCVQSLINFGIKQGIIQEDYILVAHNQTYNDTESPGKNAYAEIKTWPHWKEGYFPDI